jgi:hypothetical protein
MEPEGSNHLAYWRSVCCAIVGDLNCIKGKAVREKIP